MTCPRSYVRNIKPICNVNQIEPEEKRMFYLSKVAERMSDLKPVILMANYPSRLLEFMESNKIGTANILCMTIDPDFRIDINNYTDILLMDIPLRKDDPNTIMRSVFSIMNIMSRYNFGIEITVPGSISFHDLYISFINLSRIYNINFYSTEHFRFI